MSNNLIHRPKLNLKGRDLGPGGLSFRRRVPFGLRAYVKKPNSIHLSRDSSVFVSSSYHSVRIQNLLGENELTSISITSSDKAGQCFSTILIPGASGADDCMRARFDVATGIASCSRIKKRGSMLSVTINRCSDFHLLNTVLTSEPNDLPSCKTCARSFNPSPSSSHGPATSC